MENQLPKVSIIVPIYNVEKYLDRCMDSLLNQTLKDIEIIMVDDGSPDRCPQMCDEYAKQDGRIRVIHKKNAGLGYARNSGLEVATGEYVAFVDSDDYVDTSMYEKLYNQAKASKSDAVFCGLRREYAGPKYVNRQEVAEVTYFEGEDVKNLCLDFIASAPGVKQERKYEMSVWHSVYSFNVINQNDIRFLSERDVVSEDLPFQVDFFKVAVKVCFIPDLLYIYCMNNSNSLTATFKFEKFYGEIRLFHHLKDVMKQWDPLSYRSKRFLIGYMRSMAICIAITRLSIHEKLALYKKMVNDDIWKEIDYKYQYLPTYARICFFLQKKKCANFLYLYSAFLKKIRHYKA